MVLVQNVLVVGIGVNGGHQSAFDAERIIYDFGHRCYAVCGTRRVRDNVMGGRVILTVVYAQYDC